MQIASRLVVLLTVLSLPVLIGGCPPPDGNGGNTAPIANAGPNQSVATGASVTLNGAGTDADAGDVLTFSWTQLSGTQVALNGANTATATFTAPNTAGTLVFQLTVSDGTASATDTVEIGVNTQVTATPVLLVANFNGNNVVGFNISNPNNVNGNIAPSANLAGAQTQLSQPTDIVLDVNGSLLVTNNGTNSITTYADAADLSGINGNVAPLRNVQGAATLLNIPASLAFRTTSDLLFVSDIGTDAVQVFQGASTSGFNGNLAPIRTITSGNFTDPIGINFGAGDTLYVADSVIPRVAVFDNASTLNGNVTATRTITSAAFTALFDVFVDTANNRMFVVDFGDDQIHVFNNASTRNGNIAPDVTLTVPGAGQLTAIAVDANGVGYIVDNTLNAVYSYDNIATRNGTIAPDRTLQGAATQLNGPIRVFLSQ